MIKPPNKLLLTAVLLPLAGCASEGRDDEVGDGPGNGPGGTDDGAGDDGDDDDGDDGGIRYDVDTSGGEGGGDDDGPCDPSDPDCKCTIPEHAPCDAGTADPFHAMGLNCPGELQVQASTTGSPQAIGVRGQFGQNDTFDPREGELYTVIGSGFVDQLDNETPSGDEWELIFPTHCSADLDGLGSNTELGPLDPDGTIPAPIDPNAVGTQDCEQDPSLVGTGDCSNTIQQEWDQGASSRDYTDLRFTLTVPEDVVSFSYDFAFFTTEYPEYLGSQYNDFYVGWLESEKWTGNVSFDEQGSPISLNAAFMEFKDDAGTLPELAGTCMKYHASTNWLTTTAGVTGGEDITVVFAIMDLSDSILDSYVFLDNWKWGCVPTGKPDTRPPG